MAVKTEPGKRTVFSGLKKLPVDADAVIDMDTAMGIDNAGAQIVRPDVLDEELINSPELTRKFASGTYSNEKMYTVRDNKLWGILDNSEFKDQYVGNANEGRYSVYAST